MKFLWGTLVWAQGPHGELQGWRSGQWFLEFQVGKKTEWSCTTMTWHGPSLCPQTLIGKCFVFLLPYSRDKPRCLLHTCENSRFFAFLTSKTSILDGLDEQKAGESHPTCARKFFTRSGQPRSYTCPSSAPALLLTLPLLCAQLDGRHSEKEGTSPCSFPSDASLQGPSSCLFTTLYNLQNPGTKHGARTMAEP